MKCMERSEIFSMITEVIMLLKSQEEIFEYLELIDIPTNPNIHDLRKEVFDFVSEINKGVSNGYLSEIYYTLTGHRVEVIGNAEDVYQCACCGFKTLSEKYGIDDGGYDICDVCGWEDDGTTEYNLYSSVNRTTIQDKREFLEKNNNFFYRFKWYK